LRSALERDDWEMSPLSEELNREIEFDSRLATDENLRRGTAGSSWPTLAWFESRRPNRLPTVVVNLVGGSTAEPGVRPEVVVPGAIERQFLLQRGETVRDDA